MQKYLLNQNELESLLRYQILYKWKEWQKINLEEDKSFAQYLFSQTPYKPNHEFIQSFCETKEERENPVAAGIYKEIRPADVAKYQMNTLYTIYQNE